MLTVGVQSAPWYREEDPTGSLRTIRDCGFDAVDFNIDQKWPSGDIRKGVRSAYFARTEAEIRADYRPLKAALAESGVFLSQMHAPFPLFFEGDDALNRALLDAVAKVCAVCRDLDCPAVVVHPIDAPDPEAEIAVNLALYRPMIPIWQNYGVTLCLENLFRREPGRCVKGRCSEVGTVTTLIDTLNAEAGGPAFGFCLDVGHANLTGQNLRDYLRKLGHRLTILHLHENDGRADQHMMPYTTPTAAPDWEAFCAGLADIHWRGTLNFETFSALVRLPREAWPELLRTIAVIGRGWAVRVAALEGEAT